MAKQKPIKKTVPKTTLRQTGGGMGGSDYAPSYGSIASVKRGSGSTGVNVKVRIRQTPNTAKIVKGAKVNRQTIKDIKLGKQVVRSNVRIDKKPTNSASTKWALASLIEKRYRKTRNKKSK